MATALQARFAGGRVAVGAAGTAVVAHLRFAARAVAAVVRDVRTTRVTSGAVPLAEPGIWTAAVIRVQHLVNDLKEIGQSAGAQGLLQGESGVSFAQSVAHHMWMGDVGMAVRTTRTDGLNQIRRGKGRIRPRFPIQDDAEGAQVNVFQDDRLGDDRQRPLAQIDLAHFKLLPESAEFFIDLGCGRSCWGEVTRSEAFEGVRDLAFTGFQLRVQLLGNQLGGELPISLFHARQPCRENVQLLKAPAIQGDRVAVAGTGLQKLFQVSGSAPEQRIKWGHSVDSRVRGKQKIQPAVARRAERPAGWSGATSLANAVRSGQHLQSWSA